MRMPKPVKNKSLRSREKVQKLLKVDSVSSEAKPYQFAPQQQEKGGRLLLCNQKIPASSR